MTQDKKLDEALALLQELKSTTSRALENHRQQLANNLHLVAGLSALLENHTAALKSHQTLLESIGPKVGIPVTVADPDEQPGGPIN